jgi:hypothetical protein
MSSEGASGVSGESPRSATWRIGVWSGDGRHGSMICLLRGGGRYWSGTLHCVAILALRGGASISP